MTKKKKFRYKNNKTCLKILNSEAIKSCCIKLFDLSTQQTFRFVAPGCRVLGCVWVCCVFVLSTAILICMCFDKQASIGGIGWNGPSHVLRLTCQRVCLSDSTRFWLAKFQLVIKPRKKERHAISIKAKVVKIEKQLEISDKAQLEAGC